MKPESQISNVQFWLIAESEEFIAEFHKSGHHPMLPDNGGYEFYNPADLQKRIDFAVQKLAETKDPKNNWLLTKSLATYRSWWAQARWIESKITSLE